MTRRCFRVYLVSSIRDVHSWRCSILSEAIEELRNACFVNGVQLEVIDLCGGIRDVREFLQQFSFSRFFCPLTSLSLSLIASLLFQFLPFFTFFFFFSFFFSLYFAFMTSPLSFLSFVVFSFTFCVSAWFFAHFASFEGCVCRTSTRNIAGRSLVVHRFAPVAGPLVRSRSIRCSFSWLGQRRFQSSSSNSEKDDV